MFTKTIGIDGRPLTKQKTGISRVVFEVLKCLRQQDYIFKIHLSKNVNQAFAEMENWSNLNFVECKSFMGSPIYRSGEIDVFWGPAHRLPLGLPHFVPSILTIHDLTWRKFSQTMTTSALLGEKLHFSRSILKANKIVCVSESTSRDLVHFYPEIKNKISTVRLAGLCAPIISGENSTPFALFVGTFEPRKNIENIIKAYASLPQTIKLRFSLKFAGRVGWGGVCPLKLASKYKIQSYVEVIESPNEEMIQKLYASCLFVLLPSLYEGFGLPILEAFNFGKPVLTSKSSSMVEIGETGAVYVTPQNSDEIKQKMELLICDRYQYEKLSTNALRISKKYSWEKTANQMDKLFRSFANKKVKF